MMIHTLFILLQAETQSEGDGFTTFLPLILIVIVFYFFMIRPNLKKQKDLKKYRENLKQGNKIITIGGVHGNIIDIKERVVIIEVEDKSKLRIEKTAIIKDMTDLQNRK